MKKPVYAPREVFEQILEYAVIPTFDLVIEMPDGGIVLVKRKIDPYKNKWALPGLRMYKQEDIDDALHRIARDELGITIDTTNKKLLGQYVGRFSTENNRQDLSTGYFVRAKAAKIKLNQDHFSDYIVINHSEAIPQPIGAMYKFYLEQYFQND